MSRAGTSSHVGSGYGTRTSYDNGWAKLLYGGTNDSSGVTKVGKLVERFPFPMNQPQKGVASGPASNLGLQICTHQKKRKRYIIYKFAAVVVAFIRSI